MRSIKFFCFAAVCTVFLLTACGPEPTADEWMRKSLASAKEAKWSRALDQAEHAVDKAPGSTLANVLHAIALEHNNRPEEALSAAVRAGADSSSFIAQYTLGRVCMESPEHKGEAMRALLHALKMRRDDRDTLVSLCNLGIEVASPNALSFLSMLKRDPEFAESPELRNQTAMAYLRRNDIANARRMLIDAWRLGRNDATINYNAGCLFDRYLNAKTVALKLYRNYMQLSENLAEETPFRAEVAARIAALEETR